MRKFVQLAAAAAMIGSAGAAMPAAAQVQPPAGEILARELYFEERGPKSRALWTADPLIARHPHIFRSLRAEGVEFARLGDDCSGDLPCYREVKHDLGHAGPRLVSVFATIDQFTGGAHGAVAVEDRIYDLRTGRRLRFGDLFTDWRRARALLQPKICESLRQMRESMEGIECPDANDLAYGLSESGVIPIGGPATGFEVRMSDYALGSYAAGREKLFVDLDPALHALIKPEYRTDFRLPN